MSGMNVLLSNQEEYLHPLRSFFIILMMSQKLITSYLQTSISCHTYSYSALDGCDGWMETKHEHVIKWGSTLNLTSNMSKSNINNTLPVLDEHPFQTSDYEFKCMCIHSDNAVLPHRLSTGFEPIMFTNTLTLRCERIVNENSEYSDYPD